MQVTGSLFARQLWHTGLPVLARQGFVALVSLCICVFVAGALRADTLTAGDCVACHQQQHRDWQQSHHAKAMQRATEQTVLGRFDGSATVYGGHSFRFFKHDQRFQVSIQQQGIDQPPLVLDVPYTFGFSPLQQYLASLPKGKLQALPVAWDSRPANEGGQRWYALDSDLPWEHPGFTWNTSCASCHSTGLSKGFDAVTGAFDTRWDEINVSCTACHGDSGAHGKWLAAGRPASAPEAGFPLTLDERGQWHWPEKSAIASRKAPPSGEQLSTCGQCHARREEIGRWHPGQPLLEHSVPAMITPPLYFADGQIRDEVFVLGSFMQSRMHRAGVVCSNCHEPHSLSLRAEGDQLCAQCHRTDVFANPNHHQHPLGVVNCLDCHMPATVYMGVDARRDHRFGVPDPLLSASLGSPDPCKTCHQDTSAESLAASIGKGKSASLDMTRLFAGYSGNDSLLRYRLEGESFPTIRQASLLASRARLDDPGWIDLLRAKLGHDDPLLRVAAVRAASELDASMRWQLLSPLIDDPVRAVRLALAFALADAVPVAAKSRVAALFEHYENAMSQQLDNPAAVANFGNYFLRRGNSERSASMFTAAIALDSGFAYPYLQLAELARRRAAEVGEKTEKAWLDGALAAAPEAPEVYSELGLYHVRAGDYGKALARLARAHELAPSVERHALTYAVALESQGRVDEAIAALGRFYREHANTAAMDLLLRYAVNYNKTTLAREYSALWLEREPDSAQARQWLRYLQLR